MLTCTDLFCGAGGSSIGAETAGVTLAMAANHWPKAIEVHQTNFPAARHDIADLSQVDPRRYPRTDILMASPSCTNHSAAKGVSRKAQNPSLFDSPDLSAERSRATMWDAHRFTEQHRYDAVIVENVVDAARWVYWPSWWQAWTDAGYTAKVVNLNSAHTGLVPQWRDRIYIVAVRNGIAFPDVDPRPPCWCPECETVVEGRQVFRRHGRTAGKWRQSYDYRCPSCAGVVDPPAPPAASIIDWTLPAGRIGDRDRPLADATRARISRALAMYGPSLIAAAGNTWERPGYTRAWPLGQPAPTQAATAQHGLAVPPPSNAVVVPLRNHTLPTPASVPTATIAAGGNHHGLLFAPQSGGEGQPTSRPAPSQATKATPLLVNPAATLDVDDCGFRMLEPHEIGRAMAFPDSYRVDGTKRDRVRLYGNAVTPPAMEWLISRVRTALEGAA